MRSGDVLDDGLLLGPESGGGMGEYSDFVVDVLNVVIGGFRGDEEPVGDLLRCQSSCGETQDIDFSAGGTCGIVRPGGRGRFEFAVTGGSKHGLSCVKFEHPLRGESAKFGCGVFGGESRTVDAEALMVAGVVTLLMMSGCNRIQRSERWKGIRSRASTPR